MTPYRLRYAPSLGILATELSIDQRLELFVAHGLNAVEYSCAGRPGCGLMRLSLKEVEDLRKKLDFHGLQMGVFVANTGAWKGAGLCLPEEQAAFLSELRKAVDYHRVIENRFCTILVGPEKPDISRHQQKKNVTESLKAAAELLEATDLTIVVEPINPRDSPGYFLVSSHEAAEIVDAVNSPHVRILFDIYHQRMSGEDVIARIRTHYSLIGYYQAGDVPGRKEPGTGEMDWKAIFKTIYETGYRGLVGMEHDLSVPGQNGLRRCIEAYRQADSW